MSISLHLSFALKFLRTYIFPAIWIWLIFGMMIDIGPVFYSLVFYSPLSPTLAHDLKVKVTDLGP